MIVSVVFFVFVVVVIVWVILFVINVVLVLFVVILVNVKVLVFVGGFDVGFGLFECWNNDYIWIFIGKVLRIFYRYLLKLRWKERVFFIFIIFIDVEVINFFNVDCVKIKMYMKFILFIIFYILV